MVGADVYYLLSVHSNIQIIMTRTQKFNYRVQARHGINTKHQCKSKTTFCFCGLPLPVRLLNIKFQYPSTISRLDYLLHGIQKDISMVLLEDQHGPQSHGALSTSTNIDTNTLRLLQEFITSWAVKSNESSLSLASQVLELSRVLLSQALDTSIQIISNLRGMVDEIQTFNLLDDSTEEERTSWVTHPGVKLAVWLVRAELRVAEVVACCLGFLRECHHVGWCVEVPVVVRPELAGCANSSLYFVHDHEDVMLLGESTQTAEEGG